MAATSFALLPTVLLKAYSDIMKNVDQPLPVLSTFNEATRTSYDVTSPREISALYLNLDCISDTHLSTTHGGACLDLRFARHITTATLRYISNFSYNRLYKILLSNDRS